MTTGATESELPDTEAASAAVHPPRLLILLGFGVIYCVWGMTFLAIRFAVQSIPPLLVAGLRSFIAGCLLFGWAWWHGQRPQRQEWASAAIIGVLFFGIGHGALHTAEKTVPSGLAALLIATEPIWITVLLAAVTGVWKFSLSTILGLGIGLAGVALLFGGGLHSQVYGPGVWLVLLSAVAWSVGVIYTGRARLPRDPLLSASMQLLCGSTVLLVISTILGAPARVMRHGATPQSLAGLAFLALVGSLVGFTTYSWLLRHCPPTLVATHTYVNPVVAVVLGWAVAGESITARVLLAGACILAAVVLIRREPQPAA